MNINIKKAILYLRFSDDKQKGGTTIATQEKACRTYCENEGYQVVDVAKDEAISADGKKATHRVADLLEYCKERKGRFSVLVVWKLDRFARDQEQHHWLRGQLLRMDILLRSATERIDESPSGQLIEGVLAAVNEYDNEIKRERVKIAMWRRIDEGLFPWQPPIGYKSNRTIDQKLQVHVLDESCADVVKHIFLQYSSGTSSKTDLASELSKRKVVNYKGKVIKFSKQTIHNMLNNMYYIGKLKHVDGRILDGRHKPLISSEIFQRCQDVQKGKSNNATGSRFHYNPDFPLRKFMYCDECNQPMTGTWSQSEHSGKYAHYYCYNPTCKMKGKTFRRSDVENAFSSYLAQVKPSEEFIQRFHDRFITRYAEREQEIRGDYLRQADHIKKLNDEKTWIIDQGKQHILAGETLREQVADIEQRMALAKLELRDMHSEELDINALLSYAYDFIRTIEKAWCDAVPEYKIKLQRFIFPKGIMYGKSGFTNLEISPLFQLISVLGADQSIDVTPSGFGPEIFRMRT